MECRDLWVSGPWGLPRGLSRQARSAFLAWLLGRAPWPEGFVKGGDGSHDDCCSDVVGWGLPGIEPLHVAAVAEQVPVQGEAAAALLVAQLHPAVLGKGTQFTSAQVPWTHSGYRGWLSGVCPVNANAQEETRERAENWGGGKGGGEARDNASSGRQVSLRQQK